MSHVIESLKYQAEDIALIRNLGFEVDDDNMRAEENILDPDTPIPDENEGLYPSQIWAWRGIDQRRISTPSDVQPGFHHGWSPCGKSFLEIFRMLFPMEWLTSVLIEETSKVLVAQGQPLLVLGEMPRYIWLWLLMATCS